MIVVQEIKINLSVSQKSPEIKNSQKVPGAELSPTEVSSGCFQRLFTDVILNLLTEKDTLVQDVYMIY